MIIESHSTKRTDQPRDFRVRDRISVVGRQTKDRKPDKCGFPQKTKQTKTTELCLETAYIKTTALDS